MYTWSKNRFFYKALLILSVFPVYRAVLVNRTIDSNRGDLVTGFVPIYQPQSPSPWDDQTCSGCWIQPDITLAYDGTWNAATYHPELKNVNITLRFTGLAVWVFFILSNANSHGTATTTNTQVNITLDGHYAGSFSHDPDMTTKDLIYNATIFSASGLANTSHELVIATNDYPISTFINFDWALYTADVYAPASQSISSSTTTASSSTINPYSSTSSSSTPSQDSSSGIGIIVGCTIGVLAVVALVVVFFLRRFRRPPPVRNETVEGVLNIDPPPHQPPNDIHQMPWHGPSASSVSQVTYFPPSSSSGTQSPIRDYAPTRRKAETVLDMDQIEIDRRIPSLQREIDSLRSIRNARSAGDIIGSPSEVSQPRHMPDIASLIDEVQQLRDEIGHLRSQRRSDLSPRSTNSPLPPPYTTLQ